MPLEQGSSREVVGRNIKTEERHGKKPSQAIAIALKEAGLSNQQHERQKRCESYNKTTDGLNCD